MHELNARREAATLVVLAVIGGLLLACGVWVTGADAMIETLRSTDATEQPTEPPPGAPTPGEPVIVEGSHTVPAPGEVEGGPDEVPPG